jgi:hypothetical protein
MDGQFEKGYNDSVVEELSVEAEVKTSRNITHRRKKTRPSFLVLMTARFL